MNQNPIFTKQMINELLIFCDYSNYSTYSISLCDHCDVKNAS